MTEVSTRPVAEIDLESSRLPAGVLPMAEVEQKQCGLSLYSTSSMLAPLRAVQVNKEMAVREKAEGGRQASLRVSLGDVASFVRRTYESELFSGAAHSPAADRKTSLYGKALTNWLRSIADDERSRPILDIEEECVAQDRPIKVKTKGTVSVSPRLRRKEPTTRATGLGYVSAGLLLWLESGSEPEEGA